MNKKEYEEILDKELYQGATSFLKKMCIRLRVKYSSPSLHVLYLIRKMQFFASKKNRLYRYYSRYIQSLLVRRYSCCISPNAIIGKGLHLPHPVGIVIGASVIIGENVSIYQHVTLGGLRTGDVKKRKQPRVGSRVCLFAHSIVLGDIVIADDCIIGAASLVLHDCVKKGVYVGSPAKKKHDFSS